MAEEEGVSIRDALELAYEEHVGEGDSKEAAPEKGLEDTAAGSQELPDTKGDSPPAAPETDAKKPSFRERATVGREKAEATATPVETAPAPSFWPKDSKVEFSKLPPAIQSVIATREKQRDQAVNKYINDVQLERQQYKGFNEVFTPEKSLELQTMGLNPVTATQRLWAWHQSIESNPAEGITRLMRQYNLSPEMLMNGQVEQPPAEDVRFEELQRKYDELAQTQEQREADRELQTVKSQIAAFAQEKDAQGNLARPHFEDLKPVIKQILPLVYQENPGITDYDALHQAWERAAYADPNVRGEMLQKQAPPTLRPNQVRPSSLRGSPSPSATAPTRPKSIRDALNMAAADHGL